MIAHTFQSQLFTDHQTKATPVVVDPTVEVSSSKAAVVVVAGKRVECDTFSLRPCDTHVRIRGQNKKVALMHAANGQLCSGLKDIIPDGTPKVYFVVSLIAVSSQQALTLCSEFWGIYLALCSILPFSHLSVTHTCSTSTH